MGALDFVRKTIPRNASREERLLYDTLLKDATRRDRGIDAALFNLPGTQRQALASPKGQELVRQQSPLGVARSNLLTARDAAPHVNDDETARLLLAHGDGRHQASLLSRLDHFRGDRGILDNAVYIEGLSSEVPGGGTQLLEELEREYPGAAMYLGSISHPETLRFYEKRGFVPQPERSSDTIPKNLFVKPAGKPIQRAEGGLTRTSKTKTTPGPTRPLGLWSQDDMGPSRSVLDPDASERETLNTVQELIKTALGVLPAGSLGAQLPRWLQKAGIGLGTTVAPAVATGDPSWLGGPATGLALSSGDAEAGILNKVLRYPKMAPIIDDVPISKFYKREVGSVPLYRDPTGGELRRLMRDSVREAEISGGIPSIRTIRDLRTPDTVYAWDGEKLLHDDILNHLGIDSTSVRRGSMFPEDDLDTYIEWLKKLPQNKRCGGLAQLKGAK